MRLEMVPIIEMALQIHTHPFNKCSPLEIITSLDVKGVTSWNIINSYNRIDVNVHYQVYKLSAENKNDQGIINDGYKTGGRASLAELFKTKLD